MLTALVILAMSGGALSETACVATAREVRADEPIAADAIEPVNCRADQRPARLRFDHQSRSVTAGETLPAGTYLGRLLVSKERAVPKGAKVTLRAMSGPAIVERQVTTLQPARSGQRVFVRDEAGNVFAVPLQISDRGQVE